MTIHISFHVDPQSTIVVARDPGKNEPLIRFGDPDGSAPKVVCFFTEESFENFCQQMDSFRSAVKEPMP